MASASTPVNQKGRERNNFYRFNSLIVDNSKDAFINILELHLSKINQSFVQFINVNQHEIYHLCYNKPCCKGSCTSSGKRILQVPQLELLFDKNGSTLPGHRGSREFCCCTAKPNIKIEVLDITLAYCLLINFCSDVFWYCCLDVNQPSVTLEDFLNIHKHDLYHLKVGPRTCCQCPPGYISTVTNAQLVQSDWTSLFRRSGQPCNLPYHVYDSCCSVTATPGITKFSLNNHLTTTLHKHVCEARKHLEVLRNYRNGSFAHLKKGSLSDHEYQSAASDIKKAILHIAKVCNKEKEANDALDDLERRPLDHYSFLEHHNYTLQQAINFIELKESIDGIVTARISEIVYRQSETQACQMAQRDKLIRITEEEVMSDNARAKINDVINRLLVTQPGNSFHRKTTPTRTVTNLKDLIEVILHDSSHENNDHHGANFFQEVRRNIDNSGVFKPSDHSIKASMIRYLPDGMTNDQKTAYSEAISALKVTLIYLVGFKISVLSANKLTSLLEKVNIGDRNEVIKKLRKEIKTLMNDCRRRNFRQCMQCMSAYYNLCVLWDIVVLYLSAIFSINSGHSKDDIIEAEKVLIDRQRRKDKKLIKCFVQPQKENVLFALLYTPNQWLPLQAFLDSRDMKSESLDHLCNGQFTFTPLESRKAKVFMSMFGSCLRWAYSNNKWTNFKFEKTTEAGKTYFHIFPADYPNYYVKMGMFSWLVRCKKGDPKGCNNGTWVIERLKYNGDECYVLCTKDSNGNCLSAGSTRRLYGKRGVINKRRMWLIRKSNSFNGDSTSQLMQTM